MSGTSGISGNLLEAGGGARAGAMVSCPHGGRAAADPGAATVRIGGAPVVTAAHAFTVTGCPHTVDGVPTPCVTVRWTAGASGVTVDGAPVLLDSSAAQCFTAAFVPQGPPVVHSAQREVSIR